MESEPYSRMFHLQIRFQPNFCKGDIRDAISYISTNQPITYNFGNHTDSNLFQQIERSKERFTSLHKRLGVFPNGQTKRELGKKPGAVTARQDQVGDLNDI